MIRLVSMLDLMIGLEIKINLKQIEIMKLFKVSWTIEVDAENNLDAAVLADKIMTQRKNQIDVINQKKFVVEEVATSDLSIIDLSDKDLVKLYSDKNE